MDLEKLESDTQYLRTQFENQRIILNGNFSGEKI